MENLYGIIPLSGPDDLFSGNVSRACRNAQPEKRFLPEGPVLITPGIRIKKTD